MKKLNLYKIYSISKGDLTKESFSESELLEREITLSSNNLIRKYLIFKDIKENDMHLDNIIKVALPHDKKDAEMEQPLEVLKNGVTFMQRKFVPLVSSPSMMKKEGVDDNDEEFKCEYIFIAEEDQKFVDIFEDITSAGKLTEKRAEKEKMALNKDVIARLSLNTSSSWEIKYKPNVVILSSDKYSYIADYCYFANGDYSKLEYERNKSDKYVEHEFQDGCGLMSSKMAEIIKENVGVDYPIDWAGIRMDIHATKGLVVKIDFNAYFDEMYKEDIKDIFEKREDGYYTLDCWGKMVNISKADLILTTNMSKWAKWWKSQEEINQEIKKEKYNKYRNIMTNLYITKFNKKKQKEYSRTNYQLISNLSLVPRDLETLCKDTEDMYRKVLDFDVNYVRLMLGDTVKDFEDGDKVNALDKVHYLLQSTEDAINIPFVKKTVISMVNKKIRELAEGRFYIRGNYKTASTCPITFMDWIMTRKFSNNGLKENEFYIPRESGNRVMSRNPLNSFSEIHKFTIAKNDLLEKYCGDLTSELIFFNQKDNRAMLNSGEDFDLDSNFVIDNDIIYNSVISAEKGYNFLNIDDNKDAVEKEYTKENEYYCVVKASGNQIGSISNIGIKICTQATELGYLHTKNNETYGYKQLRDMYYEKNEEFFKENIREIKQLEETKKELANLEKQEKEFGYMWTEEDKWMNGTEMYNLTDFKNRLQKIVDEKKKEYFTQALEKLIENGSMKKVEDLSDQEIKEILIRQFYNLKTQSYLALQLQQVAIDSPKTLKGVDEELKKLLKDSIREKNNPIFRKYATKYEDRSKSYSSTHSVLNLHAKRIQATLMQDWFTKNEEIKQYAKSDRVSVMYSILSNAKEEENVKLIAETKEIFKKWRDNAERIRSDYKDKQARKSEELKKNNLHTSRAIIELTEKYGINVMAVALLKICKSSNSAIRTKFLIDCCFNIIQPLLDTYYNDITIFKKDENGEYSWMFEKYNKVKAVRKIQDMQMIQNRKDEIALGEAILLKFRLVDIEKIVLTKKDNNFFINDEQIFNNKVKGAKKFTYDLLEELLENETELEVKLNNIEIKPTYIVATVNV